MLFTFTACGQNQDTATPPTELELEQEESPSQEPEYEYANNIPTTTVRFYYHSIEIDPNIYLPPESFLYNAEVITAENLLQEFIRLMYEHTGLHILDMWFEGDKLYVNLHSDAFTFFNGHGTTGGMRNTKIFERSILSLPGIASFEVLLDGRHGVYADHFDFGHVAIVENGEVIRREFFDVTDIDNPAASHGYDIPASRVRVISDGNEHGAFRHWNHGFSPIENASGWFKQADEVADDLTPFLFNDDFQIIIEGELWRNESYYYFYKLTDDEWLIVLAVYNRSEGREIYLTHETWDFEYWELVMADDIRELLQPGEYVLDVGGWWGNSETADAYNNFFRFIK